MDRPKGSEGFWRGLFSSRAEKMPREIFCASCWRAAETDPLRSPQTPWHLRHRSLRDALSAHDLVGKTRLTMMTITSSNSSEACHLGYYEYEARDLSYYMREADEIDWW